MRQLLSVAIVGGLSGCSLIYNPGNLPAAPGDGRAVDAAVDAEIIVDADPAQLAITKVSPSQIFEGQGDGGSRAALIVVDGTQMVPGARITLTKHSDHSPFSMAVVDDANTVVAADGKQIAAPVKFLVDPLLPMGTDVRLDVTVTQPSGGTTIAKTLDKADASDAPVLVEKGLDEITDTPAVRGPLLAGNKLPTGTYLVSQVNITMAPGGKGITPNDLNGPLLIRAISSVNVAGTIAMDASGVTHGPGGNDGGAGGPGSIAGASPGSGGGGGGGGKPNGGGGGFKTQGMAGMGAGGPPSGEPELLFLSVGGTADAGSGGAGGAGGALGAAGGAGGGGGGTVELTAGGDLTVVSITAKGGAGTAAGSGNGGGGSGGAVLLRAGRNLAVSGTINVDPGAAGGAGAGAGSIGRVRVDAPAALSLGFQGPQFVATPILGTTTLITRDEQPMIVVRGNPTSTFSYFFANADRSTISPVMMTTIAGNGQATFTVGSKLGRGLNHFCVTPAGGSPSTPAESQNCTDIVYLFKQPAMP